MCNKKIPAWLGLLQAGCVEPDSTAGYARVYMGEIDLWSIPFALQDQQFVFNEVQHPGYGTVHMLGMYSAPEYGDLLYIWDLPEAVQLHEGVVPGVLDGKLVRGMDVSAHVLMQLSEQISTTKFKS